MLGVVERYALGQLLLPDYFTLEPLTVSLGRYADALGEVLLADLQPRIEALCSATLLPTYSFLRFYTPDSKLEKHVDRPSCELTVTLTIARNGQASWPIWLELPSGNQAVDLAPGDLLAFSGSRLPHWREPLQRGWWLQLFLHYVRADGAFAERRYDGRKRLGPWITRTPAATP